MIALLLAVLFGAAPIPAVITRIVDGDTVDTTVGKVRLKCVDAPEKGQYPFGTHSSKTLASLLPVGSYVELRGKTSGGFGRIAAEVVRNGTNVNLEMVAKGQAFVYWNYLSGCNRADYSAAESSAKSKETLNKARPALLADPNLIRETTLHDLDT